MVHKSPAPAKVNPPVDARKATESAFAYFHTLFSKIVRPSADPLRVELEISQGHVLPAAAAVYEASLEEIEMSKDGRFWLVTLGYNEPRAKDPRLPGFLQVPMRKLKVFKVDAATGRVLSMKIPHDE